MANANPLIIFVPGLGATGETYRLFLDRLAPDYEVRVAMHSLDFPARLDWKFFFKPIDEAASDGKRFYLIGHSMGGEIALAYAARHPQRVRKVIAVAPPLFPRRSVNAAKGLIRFRWFRRVQNIVLGIISAHPRHALRSVQIRMEVLADGRRRRLYDWVNHVDLSADLSRLRHAVVLWAKREEIVQPYHVERLQREFPNVAVKFIPGTHNYLPLNPGPVMGAIRRELEAA